MGVLEEIFCRKSGLKVAENIHLLLQVLRFPTWEVRDIKVIAPGGVKDIVSLGDSRFRHDNSVKQTKIFTVNFKEHRVIVMGNKV